MTSGLFAQEQNLLNSANDTISSPILRIDQQWDTVIDLENYLFVSYSPAGEIPEQWSKWEANSEVNPRQGNLWYRFVLANQNPKEVNAILYLHDLPEVTVYHRLNNDPALDTTLAGTSLPFSQRQLLRGKILEGIGFSAQTQLALSSGTHQFFLRTNIPFDQMIRPQLSLWPVNTWDTETTAHREHYLLWQGILFGALLILSLYHLLIFLQKGDKAFLWYALYTFLCSVILLNETGVLQIFLFTEHQQIHALIKESLVLSLTVTILYFLFMRSFVGLSQLLPKLDQFLIRFLWFLGISGYLLALIYWIWGSHLALSIGRIFPVLTLAIGLYYIIAIIKTKDRLANYFILGSIFLVLGVLLNTTFFLLSSYDLIEPLPFPRNYFTEIGIVIEILIFSNGLGYRMRLQEKQKQYIEEINQAKSDFFANISHEFRTPLTVIMGSADQIKGNERERTLIRRNSKNLLGLVNRLLDLSKLEAGTLRLNNLQADIIPFLQYLTESFYSLAESKRIKLVFYSEEKELIMDFDEEKVQQVMYNLLSNALKFTEEGGKVIVHVCQTEQHGKQHLQVKVRDSGIGIPAGSISQIFDRFFQDATNSAKIHQGSGIGLAFTKELLGLMDGAISVQSEEGDGSEFTFLIPISKNAPFSTPASNLIQADLAKDQADTTGRPGLNRITTGEKDELLIIEDNDDVVSYLQSLLEKDHQIATARNGQQGIEMAFENIPDIIICDVMMPEKDGYAVCRELKQDERTSHIPIILLTAKASPEDRIKGLEMGADAYLTKPFNKEELMVRLEKLLHLRRTLRARYADMKHLSDAKSDPSRKNLEDTFLQKLQQVVATRLDDPTMGVVDLCRAARLSNMQVNRKLKALTGKTPSQFIRSIRLQKARHLLETTDLNISEIAYDVGFKDPNYFSRSYSEEFGHPPNVTRK